MQAHPGVKIISRNRSNEYAKGAAKGAPDAIQVADRFHLVKNLHEALELFLEQNRHCLRAAGEIEPRPLRPTIQNNKMPVEIEPNSSLPKQETTLVEKKRQITRQKRLEKYVQVMELHAQAIHVRTIARQ